MLLVLVVPRSSPSLRNWVLPDAPESEAPCFSVMILLLPSFDRNDEAW